jgi:alanine-glyoxylate transaminase/(R)-3-amino-2-methylpropionate-pyruvate transaminase
MKHEHAANADVRSAAQLLAERKRRSIMPSVGHFYADDPIQLVRGAGTRVWDVEGRSYLDCCSGVATTNLGHCHPEVVAAATLQLSTLQHATTIHLTEPMIAVAERLLAKAPGALSKVFFCADGSGACEGALMAARIATGRPDFIALEGALHGRAALSMATTGLPMWRCDPFPAARVHRLRAPRGRRVEDCVAELRGVLVGAAPNSVAAFIAEPAQGNGGIHVPPEGYFGAMKGALDEFGVLFIADEAQTGFCRTGRWFGMEHWGVAPDLMTVAKALANGLPAAAWLATEPIAQACARHPMASTFGGNLAPMAAALATLRVMERDGLERRAATLGERLVDGLRGASAGASNVVEVRGLGLMVGVEFVDAAAADRVQRGLRKRGALTCKGGAAREVVEFLPPLIATEEEIDEAVAAFAGALADGAEEGRA